MRIVFLLFLLFFVLKTTQTVEARPSTQPFYCLETFDTTSAPQAFLKEKWQIYTKNYIQFDYKNGYFWLKFDLNAAADTSREWYLWFTFAQVQDIRFFQLDSAGRILKSDSVGVNYPFFNRDVWHRLPIFSFHERTQPTVVLARFHNDVGGGNGTFGVQSAADFIAKDYDDTIIWSAIFCVMAFACLLSVGLFLVYRERVYAYYGAYLLCLLMAFLSINGFAFKYLWSDYPRMAYYSKLIWLVGCVSFFLRFITNLLFLPTDSKPRLMTFLLQFSTFFYATIFILTFSNLPLSILRVFVSLNNFYFFIAIFLIFWQIIYAIRVKSPTALYFLIAFTPSILIPGVIAAQNFGWFTLDFMSSPFIMPLGLATEAILMFVALLIRFQNIQKIQKIAQENARRAQERLQEERQRISRDLHDNVGAQLSQIVAGLDTIIDPDTHREHVVGLHETAKTTITQLRETIWALHQETVTVENFADKFKAYARAQVRLHPSVNLGFSEEIANPDVALSPLQALNFYRIGQEALNNTLKYAQASRISIHFLQNTEGVFSIEIRDNGKGFDPQEAAQKEAFGLNNMRFRAAEIGASLDIDTQTEVGTRILLSVKIDAVV